jgi:hypothetical protein
MVLQSLDSQGWIAFVPGVVASRLRNGLDISK